MQFLKLYLFLLQVDPIQSSLNLKIGLPPVLKARLTGQTKLKWFRIIGLNDN
jgi:hypothetical protein